MWFNSKNQVTTVVQVFSFTDPRSVELIKRLNKLAESKAVTVVGVVVPNYEFEKSKLWQKKQAERFGVRFSLLGLTDEGLEIRLGVGVGLINTWDPRVYGLDQTGKIKWQTDPEHGKMALRGEFSDLFGGGNIGGKIIYKITPRLEAGYWQGKIGNQPDNFFSDSDISFLLPNQTEGERLYWNGFWNWGGEGMEHIGEVAGGIHYLLAQYDGGRVWFVGGREDGKTTAVEVELDGRPIPKDWAGADLRYDEHGRSWLWIAGPALYQITNGSVYHKGKIKIKVGEAGLTIYALDFGGVAQYEANLS